MTSAVVTDGRVRPTAEADLRGDRITRQMVRLERDVGISIETIAPFIRFWLMATPSLPEQTQAAARAKGGERYEGFMQALGRRLAKGPSFIREVSLDIGMRCFPRLERAQGLEASAPPA